MVIAVALVDGYASDGVAIEDGDALTVGCKDMGATQIALCTCPHRPEVVSLASIHGDGEGFVGRPST